MVSQAVQIGQLDFREFVFFRTVIIHRCCIISYVQVHPTSNGILSNLKASCFGRGVLETFWQPVERSQSCGVITVISQWFTVLLTNTLFKNQSDQRRPDRCLSSPPCSWDSLSQPPPCLWNDSCKKKNPPNLGRVQNKVPAVICAGRDLMGLLQCKTECCFSTRALMPPLPDHAGALFNQSRWHVRSEAERKNTQCLVRWPQGLCSCRH